MSATLEQIAQRFSLSLIHTQIVSHIVEREGPLLQRQLVASIQRQADTDFPGMRKGLLMLRDEVAAMDPNDVSDLTMAIDLRALPAER